jgi:hypothetical protein
VLTSARKKTAAAGFGSSAVCAPPSLRRLSPANAFAGISFHFFSQFSPQFSFFFLPNFPAPKFPGAGIRVHRCQARHRVRTAAAGLKTTASVVHPQHCDLLLRGEQGGGMRGL